MTNKPDVIKAALSVGIISKKDRVDIDVIIVGGEIKIDNIYAKIVWNSAIEAAANIAQNKGCMFSTTDAIRRLKKISVDNNIKETK